MIYDHVLKELGSLKTKIDNIIVDLEDGIGRSDLKVRLAHLTGIIDETVQLVQRDFINLIARIENLEVWACGSAEEVAKRAEEIRIENRQRVTSLQQTLASMAELSRNPATAPEVEKHVSYTIVKPNL